MVKLLLTQCSLEAFLFPSFGLLQFFSDPFIKNDIETFIKQILASITRHAAESVLSLIQGIGEKKENIQTTQMQWKLHQVHDYDLLIKEG